MNPVEAIKNGLVVSCQTPTLDHPLAQPDVIARLAASAQAGGAVGVRINDPENIRIVKERVTIPVIGIFKQTRGEERSFITPTVAMAESLIAAGADIVALEITAESRSPSADKRVDAIKAFGVPVMADISTLEEAIVASERFGAELVGTTLSGYTPHSQRRDGHPDFALLQSLVKRGIKTVAEGRYRTADHVDRALELGAYCVVIGSAITDPIAITASLIPGPARTVSS